MLDIFSVSRSGLICHYGCLYTYSPIVIAKMSVRELESAETLYEEPSTNDDVRDDEKKDRLEEPSPTGDPFGNEDNAEVKYRVMKWW